MEVVNGYPCKTCTDVEFAKKCVDPARPDDGPNGVYKTDPAKDSDKAQSLNKAEDNKPVDYGPAVKFDGALAGVAQTDRPQRDAYIPGTVADLRT